MKQFIIPIWFLTATLDGCAGSDFAGGGSAAQQKKEKSSPSSNDKDDPEDGLGNATKEEDGGSSVIPAGGGTIVSDKPIVGEKVVAFGGDKVFHLGDGEMKDSSCSLELSVYPLSGTTFHFEFDVTEDMTLVDVSIDLCGVDIIDTNFASLQSQGTKLQELRLTPGSLDLRFQGQVLNKGHYAVVVESRNGSQDRQWTTQDHDDYMVKQVLIKGDKAVVRGKVTAN